MHEALGPIPQGENTAYIMCHFKGEQFGIPL